VFIRAGRNKQFDSKTNNSQEIKNKGMLVSNSWLQ